MIRVHILTFCVVTGSAALLAQRPASSQPSPVPAFGPEKTALTDELGRFVRNRPAAKLAPAPGRYEKSELLVPGLGFAPAKRWLFLPELAKQLGAEAAEQAAIRELLESGATQVREALAADDAANDVGAAAAFFVSQLWAFARAAEVDEAHLDVLHGQIVAALAVPEVKKLRDRDKQRFWEFCIGYPIFLTGMAEAVQDDAQLAKLRKAAALGFESVLGIAPDLLEIGPRGLTIRPGREDLARKLAEPPAPASKPAAGPAIPGITYTAPAMWAREEANGCVIFRATLGDVDSKGKPEENNSASHRATIGFLPLQTARNGATALFEETWRQQFQSFSLGDTVVHYRSRLASRLVVLYMGRFLSRPGTPQAEGNPQTYVALYLVDLGDDRYQPIVAFVEPRSTSVGMDTFKEAAAFSALAYPLGALLDSVRPAKGSPPYPAGGFFAASDLMGRWSESRGAYGGEYVNTYTGGSAGVAVTSSGGHFYLLEDGTYEYAFAYASSHPQFGKSGGSTKHAGRYRLDGDIVLVEPAKPIDYKFTCCAVGIGTVKTATGTRRILATVSANADGRFIAPPLITNWNNYAGTMSWYTEDTSGR